MFKMIVSALLFLSAAVGGSVPLLAADMTLEEFVPGGQITRPYGTLGAEGKDHTGVDVAASAGTPIAAPADAVVLEATDLFNKQPLYGKTVLLKVGDRFVAKFAHLDSYSVKPGDKLAKGDVFGTIGTTGGARRAHVHIETLVGAKFDKRTDPASIFPFLAKGEAPTPDTFYQQAVEVGYKGYGTDSVAEIYNGTWRHDEVQLSGSLFLPDGDGPFPVVILQHGSGHPNGLEGWWRRVVPALKEAGIGAFIANSYTGRGIDATSGDQGRLSRAARDVDVLMALKAVSQVPRVDARRIGITGYSFGGGVAIDVASGRIAGAVLGPELRFAAHLPAYPNCILYDKPEMTGAPIHLLLAGKDDYTPVSFCYAMIGELKEAGVPVTQALYEDAGHGFVKNREFTSPNAWTARGCEPARLSEDGYLTGNGVSDREGGWGHYVRAVLKACGTRGAHALGTAKTRQQALEDTVAFFTGTLKKP